MQRAKKRLRTLGPNGLLDTVERPENFWPFGKSNRLPPWRGKEPRHLCKSKLYLTARLVAAVSRKRHPRIPKGIDKTSKDPYIRCLIGDMVPWYKFNEFVFDGMRSNDLARFRLGIRETRKAIGFLDKFGSKNLGFNYWLFMKKFLKDNLRKFLKFRDFIVADSVSRASRN